MLDTKKYFAIRLSVTFQDFFLSFKGISCLHFPTSKTLKIWLLTCWFHVDQTVDDTIFFIPYYELKIRYSFPAVTNVFSWKTIILLFTPPKF